MRVGEGIRNALVVLILVALAHMWLQRHSNPAFSRLYQLGQTPSAPATPAPRCLARVANKRVEGPPVTQEYLNAWPSPPPEIEWANARGPSPQKAYTTDEEERAALHRLVFAGTAAPPSPVKLESRPSLTPDYSSLHMAAEQPCNLPMFDIGAKNACANTDSVSGIESWGAGYAPI
jgi:hypothetical protein